jgi:hypothetical protein
MINLLLLFEIKPLIIMKPNTFVISIILAIVILISSACCKSTCPKTTANEDSIKALILAKENAVLARWYNGDPLGFIDNSWEDVTYFDPSLKLRIDSINAFRKLLEPIKGVVHVPSHKMDKPQVWIFNDIAILTFTDVFAVSNKTFRWHATEIYQHRGNDWKLIHSHWTESKVQ